MVDRVGNTCVFCNALISEINLSVCINSYVLKKSVTFYCIVDVWLRFFVKVDNLSVASTFEVEYAIVIPTMLIITDKESEPDIYNAIKRNALLENVTLDENGKIDFADKSVTENTRVSYPIDHIRIL